MNRLYKITAKYKNNVEVEQEVMSFNALDAMEEWSVNNESEVDEILGVSCEFIRTVFNYEHT